MGTLEGKAMASREKLKILGISPDGHNNGSLLNCDEEGYQFGGKNRTIVRMEPSRHPMTLSLIRP